MQLIIDSHPELKTEFVYPLREMTTKLTAGADQWGESRTDGVRIGFAGKLQVLVELHGADEGEDPVVEILQVKLRTG